MKKKVKYPLCILAGIIVLVPVLLGMVFPNTTRLALCLVTNTLPDPGHLVRIRNDLQSQKRFMDLMAGHEADAVRRFSETGKTFFAKKYIYETPTSMFDIHSFHDRWEVRVRTDIVRGRPLTSYLVRLGLIKDTNAETFFSAQCNSAVCRTCLKALLGIYNKLFDWGIFNPIRLNITEIDDTSSVSRKIVSVDEWSITAAKIHEQGLGRRFTKPNS